MGIDLSNSKASQIDHHNIGCCVCHLLDAFPRLEKHGRPVIPQPGSEFLWFPAFLAAGSSIRYLPGLCQQLPQPLPLCFLRLTFPLPVPVPAQPEKGYAWSHELHVIHTQCPDSKIRDSVFGHKGLVWEKLKRWCMAAGRSQLPPLEH